MRRLVESGAIEGLRGRWVVLSYDQSFATRPVRPLLRVTRRDGHTIENILPAAIFGRARWLGLMPADMIGYEVLADVADPSCFRFEPVRATGIWRLRLRLALRRPTAFLGDVLPCVIRTTRGRVNNVRSALMLATLAEWSDFCARNTRPPEPDGFDRPVAAGAAPTIGFILHAGGPSLARLPPTLDALARQADGNWTLRVLVDGESDAGAAAELVEDRRLTPHLQVAVSAAGQDRIAEPGWTSWLDPGDRPAAWAVLALRAEIAASPATRLLYTDSAVAGAGPAADALALKPDWSPELLLSRNYVGGLCLFDPALAREIMTDGHPGGRAGLWPALRRAADVLPGWAVGHLPRVAVIHDEPDRDVRAGDAQPGPPRVAAVPAADATVSIVMPTRDRLDLLRPAVESVLERTAARGFELVVADNASADPATLAYLRDIQGRRGARVVTVAGEFNFSRIVNAAVATTQSDVVILLNNDIEVATPGWLDEMTGCALKPGIGAVGAKLLYPNGTLQHAGIVLGWGGYAGHFGRLQPPDAPGHLGRNLVRHEVSAVTAACLAVSRRHFDAVGGFDESFAVAFNDVDFCLRVRALGLRNLFTPHAVLVHHESASRGHDVGRSRTRFRDERRRFGERWRALLQADPYFHAALSLNKNTEFLE